MSLTDEIMQRVIQYGLTCATIGRLSAKGDSADRLLAQGRDEANAIASDLTALETELEGYRKAIIPDSEPRISARSGMALPCTSEYVNAQSDIQGEDLG